MGAIIVKPVTIGAQACGDGARRLRPSDADMARFVVAIGPASLCTIAFCLAALL